MPKTNDFELAADEIIAAAVDIFLEQGLDAVSMRSVASRLGVSPAPLYSRVGNKDSLVDAIADHLLADLAPPHVDGEPWMDYALRWAEELRHRLRRAHDSRLILVAGREAYVEASRPLVAVMRASSFAADAAVQACRLVMWATVGFVAIENAAQTPSVNSTRRHPLRRQPGRRHSRRSRRVVHPADSVRDRWHRPRCRGGVTMAIPDLRADGKVVVITGASKGLGRAMALGFAEAGADIVVASRKLDGCQRVADEVRAIGQASVGCQRSRR